MEVSFCIFLGGGLGEGDGLRGGGGCCLYLFIVFCGPCLLRKVSDLKALRECFKSSDRYRRIEV